MRTVDVEMTVAVSVKDGVSQAKLDALVSALQERFPWVTGAVVEAVIYHDEEEDPNSKYAERLAAASVLVEGKWVPFADYRRVGAAQGGDIDGGQA